MNRSLLWAGLVAGLALIVAGPARAGFSLQIENNPNKNGILIEENKNGTFSVVAPSGGTLSYSNLKYTATGSEIAGTVTIDGVNFAFDAKSNQDTKSSSQNGQVTVGLVVNDVSGGGTNFSFYAADSPFTGAAPGNSNKVVYSLNTLAGTSASGTQVSGQGVVIGTTQTYRTGNSATLRGPGQSTQISTGKIPSSQFSNYAISNIGGQIYASNGKTLHIGAAVATPEPTGVLLGVLGLPCMAGLVVWARRRRVPVAA
jgi:hypothetical protein